MTLQNKKAVKIKQKSSKKAEARKSAQMKDCFKNGHRQETMDELSSCLLWAFVM